MNFKKLLCTVAVAGMLVGCGGGSGSSDDALKLGFIGPLSGEASSYGISEQNAIKLAIADYEESTGKKVEVVYMDDKADPTEGVNAYNKLTDEEEVVAIIGCTTSNSAIPVGDASASKGTPIVSPSASADQVTADKDGNVRPNVFRVCTSDPFAGTFMAQQAKEMGYSKVAVLSNSESDYSKGLKDAYVAEAKNQGLEVVYDETYVNNASDFAAQIQAIKASGCEALFLPDYYEAVTKIVKQAKDAGVEATLLGADGWYGVLGVKGVDGTMFDGSYFATLFNVAGEDEATKTFVAKYEEAYKSEPDMFAALAYDTTMSLLQAIESAESLEPADVVKAIEATDFKGGLTGDFTYDAMHTPQKDLIVLGFENGQYKAK